MALTSLPLRAKGVVLDMGHNLTSHPMDIKIIYKCIKIYISLDDKYSFTICKRVKYGKIHVNDLLYFMEKNIENIYANFIN